jgi:hypothetical protein
MARRDGRVAVSLAKPHQSSSRAAKAFLRTKPALGPDPWTAPVRVKKTLQNKNVEQSSDSTEN